MFDILFSAIHLFNGLQRAELPGLIVLAPPRGAARGREQDFIFGYYHAPDSTPESDVKQQEWLKKTVESFYKTPGTVTSGMRQVIEKLNNDLLTRNLDRSKEGARSSASLCLAVLHHGILFYTGLGAIRSFVITRTESLDSQESEPPTRGLGISQAISPKFQQAEIHANDLIIFTPAPPLTWTSGSFVGSAELSIEALRRRLSNGVGPELKAALFRFVEGNGKALPLNMRFAQSETTQPESSVQPTVKAPAVPDQLPVQSMLMVEQPAPQSIAQAPATIREFPLQNGTPVVQNAEQHSEPVLAQTVRPAVDLSASSSPRIVVRPPVEEPDADRKPVQPRPRSGPSPAAIVAARTIGHLNGFFARLKTSSSKLLQQMLPGVRESGIHLSTPAMLIISIVVPLLVVAIGASFYNRVGRAQEFENYLAKAQEFNVQAAAQTSDPTARLATLQQAMYWLDLAGKYGASDTYTDLRSQTQAGLDSLNGIQRLTLSPALAVALDPGANISQMIATQTDLYLLDSTTGKVLRYFYAGSMFQKDPLFDCGPNQSPLGSPIGAIVDMTALPGGNSFNASLLAVDGAGNIEYCMPGDTGLVNTLNAPDSGWGKLQSITLSQSTLYVLDSAMNAVYRYEGNGVEFPDKPMLFFDAQIPSLTNAIDIEINGDELYILRSSGELVECTYSYLKDYKPTVCQDPAPYGDMRAGQTPQAVSFPEVQFIQMHMTPAPDSSIYIMDQKGKTVYHFSLQRNLQRVYLPSFSNSASMDKLTASAFAVSPGRLMFIAFQNDVQFTQLP